MNFDVFLQHRLQQLGLEERNLAGAAQVTESYRARPIPVSWGGSLAALPTGSPGPARCRGGPSRGSLEKSDEARCFCPFPLARKERTSAPEPPGGVQQT